MLTYVKTFDRWKFLRQHSVLLNGDFDSLLLLVQKAAVCRTVRRKQTWTTAKVGEHSSWMLFLDKLQPRNWVPNLSVLVLLRGLSGCYPYTAADRVHVYYCSHMGGRGHGKGTGGFNWSWPDNPLLSYYIDHSEGMHLCFCFCFYCHPTSLYMQGLGLKSFNNSYSTTSGYFST